MDKPEKMTPAKWAELFAAFDAAGIPEDFLADRDRRPSQERDWNWDLDTSTHPLKPSGEK